jgi:hypothetical protein
VLHHSINTKQHIVREQHADNCSKAANVGLEKLLLITILKPFGHSHNHQTITQKPTKQTLLQEPCHHDTAAQLTHPLACRRRQLLCGAAALVQSHLPEGRAPKAHAGAGSILNNEVALLLGR